MIVWFAKVMRWTPDQTRRQSLRDLRMLIDAHG